MPWLVGIDEAGYGPNLGPFVMSSASCHVPPQLAARNLWQMLASSVRRGDEPDDGRLAIDDSKQVYSSTRGLGQLETSLAAILPFLVEEQEVLLTDLLNWLAPRGQTELKRERWFSGTTPLPTEAEAADCRAKACNFLESCVAARVLWGSFHAEVVCATRFNGILDRWDSKGVVLGDGLLELIQRNLDATPADGEPIWFFIDKHGGRNTYAALLQAGFPDGMVVAREEGRDMSIYEVLGSQREIRLTFQPRADGTHLVVALASMISKYLRELLMMEFNAFWLEKMPGLKPTAGYPTDAVRFYQQIRPMVEQLGITEGELWRRK